MLPSWTEATSLRKAGISAAEAEALERAKGLRTVGDLLELVPRRYVRPTELTPFDELVEGEAATVVARVRDCQIIPMRPKPGAPRRKGGSNRLKVVLEDEGAGRMELAFFNAAYAHHAQLRPGRHGIFTGQVTCFRPRGATTWQMAHPQYELFDDPELGEDRLAQLQSHYIPVYSQTGKYTSPVLRRQIATLLDTVELAEPLPAWVRERRALPARHTALELVHRPALTDDPGTGMRRLRYDEAFVLQTILGQRRLATQALGGTPRPARAGGVLDAFDAWLPFELTAGQREVGALLADELAADRPMHRLLQGEVGSGKTVVALRAMLQVIDAGGQAALLAPTEVLAAQHHRTITTMLGDLALGGMLGAAADATSVALLTGSQSSAARRAALNAVVTGDAGIVVGTHALIQKHVDFLDLALVVVDEQHRFGVEQRDALREKAKAPPHLLVMTATPIPRTVAMTVFGDMETATLHELPAGRQQIDTFIVEAEKPGWLERTWARLAEEIGKGHQVYVVCPKIGEVTDGSELTADTSDEDAGGSGWAAEGGGEGGGEADRPLAGVYAVAELLRGIPALADARIAILHGRMPAEDKDAVMRAFADGTVDLLVATTVVEVGLDVPNASTMVVMDADRFGVSQLHQLRGRVGRGEAKGLCLLVSTTQVPAARERLGAIATTTDGFELARLDLRQRREGDVLGARQSGAGSSVRFLRMGHRDDEQLIADARTDAFELLAADPRLEQHPTLADTVARRLDEQQAAYLERG
ncbi:MAG TPA: ATP-dependent DNA helicase RecG [Dermatophilaceae bacterium]|nr:ATP-dependent DNA helicase RecG [Dermatophilaceae bacterium]